MEDSKEIKVENHSYQCPSCGGNMTFDPLKYSLYCEYCETSIDLQAIKSSEEYDFSLGLAEDQKWDNENIVFHCEYCGADNVKEKGSLSNNCPFCGSDSIIALDEIPGIKPHRVIPFKITKNESLNRFHKSIKKKLFVPNEIKKNFPETKLNGIYIPSWTFDASASAYYEGRLGKRYTRTVGSGKNRRTVTEIRWFRISGSKNFIFDDTLVISSKTLKDKQVEPVAPFYTNDAIVYQDEYLSGFSAEHYSVSLNDGWKIAQDKNLSVMRRGILND